jgi:hypothetical protein
MADQYCATPEQWSNIEQLASSCVYDLVILELRDRLAVAEKRTSELISANEALRERLNVLGEGFDELAARLETVETGKRSQPTSNPSQIRSSVIAIKRRRLQEPSANHIAECGGPCKQGFWNCDCGLLYELNPYLRPQAPAPAGGLVERVAHTIHDAPSGYGYENEAYAAILAVAEWLRKRGRGNAACELEQEVERG